MFVARYKQIVPLTRALPSRFIAILVAVSFVAMLVPIASASRDEGSVMACCIGKDADHCDSGLTTHKPPPPPSEPMCGLTPAAESQAGADSQTDAETVVAAESVSIGKPCPMSCGACTATASRLQKRQKDFIQARTSHVPQLGATLRLENLSRVFSSDESRTQISPRGPPRS